MTIRQHKFLLDESEMPTNWYNIVPDLPSPPPPPLHPGTHEPVGPDDLAPLFPMDLILQEVSTDRYIPIPDEVQDIYRLWRPSPAVSGRTGWSRRWALRPGSTTSTRVSRRPARTSRTPRSRRSTTTPRPASGSSPPRPAPVSGAPRWRSPARCSTWSARCGRSAPPTTRSPTGAP